MKFFANEGWGFLCSRAGWSGWVLVIHFIRRRKFVKMVSELRLSKLLEDGEEYEVVR